MHSAIFTYAKGRPWQRWLFAGLLSAFVVFAMFRSVALGALSLSAWLPVIVLGCLGLVAFRGLFDRRPALTIGPEGIWFIRWKRKWPIPWQQVRDIKLHQVGRGGPLICVYLAGQSEIRTSELPEHTFGTALLDVSPHDAFALANNHWSAARAMSLANTTL